MNERKLARIEQNLTATARKVFAAVPMQDAWSSLQIYGELKREGIQLEFAVVEGCLDSLANDGLVKEWPKKHFRRLQPSTFPSLRTTLEAAQVTSELEAVPMPNQDFLTRMGAISGELRKLADEIDAAALQATEEMEKASASGQKIGKLRDVLKEFLT